MTVPSRLRLLVPTTVLAMAGAFLAAVAVPAHSSPTADDTPVLLTPKGEIADEFNGVDESQEGIDKLRDAYYWSRLLSGDNPITLTQAATLRGNAVKAARNTPTAAPAGATRGGAWTQQGPNPIVQNGRTTNAFQAVSGRIGALVIRNDGTIILGAAQGGVWTYNATSATWTPRTSASDSQAVGALALAPSDDHIVYMGSGEGALSGDSYYGDGFYRSTDGGQTWTHVSTLFTGQAVSDIVVDPTNPQHVYASTVRGRGGNHRTTKPSDQPYGVYESTDGGATWTLRKGTTDQLHGATDLVMDPRDPNVLFASFWGDAIYKSTDGGHTWATAMTGLPAGNFLEGGTRFSLGISHPAGDAAATLYAGFDWFDLSDAYHTARVFKSTDGGASWAQTGTGTGTNSIANYCGTQCFYDNALQPDPTNPNVVYALGSYGYSNSPQSGGVYRSTDGGATWKNLGYDLHPDFHAFAFQANDTSHIAIGNDGGVWESHTGGGRNVAGSPLSTADWQNLNGTVNPATAALVHSTGLAITQFSSIATVPKIAGQFWGGTQDNGTLRKSLANQRWFDQASGDGGQVIVDQTTPNTVNPGVPAYVFGTYTGTSIYRYGPSETNTFFGNEPIDGGIDTHDRAEFYIPWVQNRGDVDQMFLGTYRMYRTDNAEAANAGDVTWTPISGDLTSGCSGSAPNGARGCLISAVGVADGGEGVYAGTDEGWIQVSPNAVISDSPSWTRVGVGTLPDRPVNQITVDRSNWRIAYAAYGGFSAATPGNSGHLFATTDGGQHWANITNNLPDAPVNSVVVDPADAHTLYAATDVGAFLSTNGGSKWFALGSGLPNVAVWQLDYDATHGVLVAGTHGRGSYTLTNATPRRALVVSKTDSGKPVGPGSTIAYTITVKNIGNADDAGVSITDPVPAHTSFVSAGSGGYLGGKAVHWDNLTVPAGGSVSVTYSARIDPNLSSSISAITNDGIVVKDVNGVAATGSPHTTRIAPAHAATIEPTSGLEGAKVGQSATFTEHITNDGYQTDTYAVSASGGSWPASVYDGSCTTPLTTTPSVAAGDTVDVCVKVDVPADAADNATNDTSFTATSTSDSSVTGSATLRTIAVAKDTLLVDQDTNDPVDSAPYYQAALTTDGVDYSYWDLAADPAVPESYLAAHQTIVWFTGNSYPAPLGPYETELAAYLDGGGHLMMSGQDILDQAAGTTAFVRNYLHISWDGSEAQNDKATADVHGVSGNPVTGAIGAVPLDHSVLGANFEDQITPTGPATSAFTDDGGATDALTVADGSYKVMFLAFPVEAYGSAADKAALVQSALTWFGS
ncbi:VPS10 domain-containing protein [Nocardioides pocheonensis]|uniref:DUF11 domain-containing protein n=1 Tax=Nocardioides pocheonensis TaxID=661485 RepID=A0A3N0GLR5_9ACTN|nr:DUF11 domain-containing protein [Nocardioides pocheonensis]RNM13078.1 DUF11 domain-containing protein [Nocardioides pocheonensis]